MNILTPQDETDTEPANWTMRAWGLALLGGLSGLLIYWIIRPDKYLPNLDHADLRAAAASFVAMAALLFGFLVERGRLGWDVAFALVGGALVGLTVYFNGPFGEGEDAWRVACAALAVAICTPLFQAWRGAQPTEGALNRTIPYPEAYRHAWTDVVLWLSAWAFVGVVWAMATLLGQLFKLIGIVILADLLDDTWMMLTLSGAALGAGVAMLRDRDRILALIQRVVTTILSVLAPLLAVGLVVFLAAIPFTGLGPLWGATRSTSPILLSCIIGALCLANAVIGEEQPHESRSPLLRASVGALGLCMLPLALIAALSTGLRIHQYGLTPDRLWAVIFTGIACAYGLAYIVTLAHRRLGAAPYLRTANLRLAMGLAVLALVLATPLLNFGTMSARDQVAMLESGRVPLKQFDWAALRFDFGRAGKDAVARLAKEGRTKEIRAAAAYALKENSRYALEPRQLAEGKPQPYNRDHLIVLPSGSQLPAALYDQLSSYSACYTSAACVVWYAPGSREAVIVTNNGSTRYRLSNAAWAPNERNPVRTAEQNQRIENGLTKGKVEVRTITRRQVYVDGLPVGENFD
ncbi:DUF4153 domain-containing protein [Novosphingobium sp. P6W]|uniref:DUF4153 domain-containing protein n=1 Tax=Novosphingobium sp. P6W TaxID=1609758 RepID=UPI0005C31502|nr:DUF4153 domain-containing protein [Novosphingobium sp. P6W]AXB78647.1 DUF4153 domain-containing protein [Novosphingobium sp. P6W]KIS30023.1 hypothetical protein TQ38_25015 [Novosphingobium sp. P6W]